MTSRRFQGQNLDMARIVSLVQQAPEQVRVIYRKRMYWWVKCPLVECEVWHWYGAMIANGSSPSEDRPRKNQYCCKAHCVEHRRRVHVARQARWRENNPDASRAIQRRCYRKRTQGRHT
jgi:hypothetical protein